MVEPGCTLNVFAPASPTSAPERSPETRVRRFAGNWPGASPKTSDESIPCTFVTNRKIRAVCATPGSALIRFSSVTGSSERVASETPLWNSPKSERPMWIRSPAVCSAPAEIESSATISPTPMATPADVSSVRIGRRIRFFRTSPIQVMPLTLSPVRSGTRWSPAATQS